MTKKASVPDRIP